MLFRPLDLRTLMISYVFFYGFPILFNTTVNIYKDSDSDPFNYFPTRSQRG